MNRVKKFWSDHYEAILVGVFTAGVVGFIGYKVNKGNQISFFEIYPKTDAVKDGFLNLESSIYGLGKKNNGKFVSFDLKPNPDFPALIEQAHPDEIYKMASTE